jgi:hypothetical protein
VNAGTASVIRIERLNIGIGAALCLAPLVFGTKPQFLGMVVGVTLTCMNFIMLRRLVFRWTADVAAGRPTNRMTLLAPKMLGMFAAVAIVVLYMPISVVTFTIGYSVFVASILIEAIYLAIKPQPPEAPEDPTDG